MAPGIFERVVYVSAPEYSSMPEYHQHHLDGGGSNDPIPGNNIDTINYNNTGGGDGGGGSSSIGNINTFDTILHNIYNGNITNDPFSSGYNNNSLNSNDNYNINNNDDLKCDNVPCYSDAFFIGVITVTILLAVFGGLGNALTVVAILTSRLRKNINSILICNLSFADTIYCAALLPMQATAFYSQGWPLGETVCELYGALRIWLIGVNMTLLSCIAFYRFLHVVHPNTHSYLSQQRWFTVAVIICWAFPFFFSFTPLVGWWGTFSFQERIFQCTFDTHSNKSHKLTVITLGYVIPCVFIIVCYARIGCVVFTSRRRTSRGSLYRRQRAKRESFRLTAMMVLIFLGFLLGTTPFFLINTLDKSLHYPSPHIWSPVIAWFMYSMNPVIYTVMDASFQTAYRRLLCCQVWKKGYNGGTPTQDLVSYQAEKNSSINKKRSVMP